MKKPKTLLYIGTVVSLIIAGVVITAIIGAVKNNKAPTDIRTKAGTTNTLKLIGIVNSVDEAMGDVIVDNVQFSQESRSGDAKNYGTWRVSPPFGFSTFSAIPGKLISFVVETETFNVLSKKVVATQMTVGK